MSDEIDVTLGSPDSEPNKGSVEPESPPPEITPAKAFRRGLILNPESSVFSETDKIPDGEPVVILPATFSSLTARALEEGGTLVKDDSVETGAFSRIAGGSVAATPTEGLFEATAQSETAVFSNEVASEAGSLKAGVPRFNSSAKSQAALMAGIRKSISLGSNFTFPCWHSGIWLTIKAPSEAELLELRQTIDSEKIEAGRATYGLHYSNSMVYTNSSLVDFILNLVVDSNVKSVTPEILKRLLRQSDISILIWALACAVYPTGFYFRRPCVADLKNCRHISVGKVAPPRMIYYDLSRLSKDQILHMSQRASNSVTIEKVELYQKGFPVLSNREVQINDEIKLMLRVPSIEDHLIAGSRWIQSVNNTYANSLTYEPAVRQTYIQDQMNATMLREYAHMVESFTYQDKIVVAEEDPGAAEEILNILTAVDSIRDQLFADFRKYIEDTQVALIGIPSYTCPKCKKEQPKFNPGSSFEELIPVDPYIVFFLLLTQKYQKIRNRQ